MSFMKKEVLEAEAARLGIDLGQYDTFAKKQSAVIAAQAAEGSVLPAVKAEAPAPQVREVPTGKYQQGNTLDDYKGKYILISPELAPSNKRLVQFDEDLGEEYVVEEVSYNGSTLDRRGSEFASGTFIKKNKTGRRVVGKTTLPKQNAKIGWDVENDLVPVVTFQGHSGYLWTHHRLPNVKGLLMESGYYEEYKEKFLQPMGRYMWHAAGSLIVVDINRTNAVFAEIERKEAERRRRELP